MATPVYDICVTAIGPLVEEFTSAGMWVFFHDGAPDELAEFALLHRSDPPTLPIVPGQVLVTEGQRFTITAVGPVANDNIRNLGHLVMKANGSTDAEMPGDVCVSAAPLPPPHVGMSVQIWTAAEVPNDTVRSVG